MIKLMIFKTTFFHLNTGTFGERQRINWFFDGPNYLPNSLPAHLYYFVDDVYFVIISPN